MIKNRLYLDLRRNAVKSLEQGRPYEFLDFRIFEKDGFILVQEISNDRQTVTNCRYNMERYTNYKKSAAAGFAILVMRSLWKR